MAGIYIHIPFCRRKCHYCNFFSVASLKNKSLMLDSMREEISLQRNYLDGQEINSVYFGGGTPSILVPEEIDQVMQEIRKYYKMNVDPEITLEANPDDID